MGICFVQLVESCLTGMAMEKMSSGHSSRNQMKTSQGIYVFDGIPTGKPMVQI